MTGEQQQSGEFRVAGLHCANCVSHVTEALLALPGVVGVDVDLGVGGPSTVRLAADRAIDTDQVRAALAAEGDYTLVE